MLKMQGQGQVKKTKNKKGGIGMDRIKEQIKEFIVKKVRENVSEQRPFFFVRWSGLFELCQNYNLDLLKLIDELHSEGRIRKALIKGKLALTTVELAKKANKKAKNILEEFAQFAQR